MRCKNCGESGHWARDCPNETKRAACILCGKDTHDSFSCTEKICSEMGITREAQDEFAIKSYNKARKAQESGLYDWEIVDIVE